MLSSYWPSDPAIIPAISSPNPSPSGEFVVVNKHLLSDLTNLGLWTPDLKNEVLYHGGSIQSIEHIPQSLKDIYK